MSNRQFVKPDGRSQISVLEPIAKKAAPSCFFCDGFKTPLIAAGAKNATLIARYQTHAKTITDKYRVFANKSNTIVRLI